MSAHRASWMLVFGDLRDDMCVLHECDNPLCVRPSHLRLGTQADNVADMHNKGRARPPRGTEHFRAKIGEADVRLIRERLDAGEGVVAISKDYGITFQAVQSIRKRITWDWVK